MVNDPSPIHGRPLRRLTQEIPALTVEQPNDLYLKLHVCLQEVIPPHRFRGQLTAEDRDLVYSAARIQAQSPQKTASLKEKLPPDLRDLPDDDLGYTEADLITWLLDNNAPRLMTVVGPRGVGKSCLLRYIFGPMWHRSESLRQYCPILLDFLSGTRTPDGFEVVKLLIDAAGRFFDLHREYGAADLFDPQSIWEWLYHPSEVADRRDSVMLDVLMQRLLDRLEERLAKCQRHLVLIFDNTDQLIPGSVSTVLSVARRLSLRHDLHVIVPLRPFNERTQMESPSDLGAFTYASIQVPPADLFQLLHRRLEHSADRIPGGRIQITVAPNIILETKNPRETVERILGRLADYRFHSVVLDQLCNYNFRLAFIALERLLKYSKLPLHAFLTDRSVPEFPHEARSRFGRFDVLNGVMLGPFAAYSEDAGQPVLNLFRVGNGTDAPLCYTIQHRVLTLLRWKGEFASRTWCIDTLAKCGYSAELIHSGITKMLRRGLVGSPETEEDFIDAQHLRINRSGKFYLVTLCCDRDYLHNVVVDTPLAHAHWSQTIGSVSDHHASLLELLSEICSAGHIELQRIMSQREYWLLDVIAHGGLLSTGLYQSLSQTCQEISASNKPGMRRWASQFQELLADKCVQVMAIEQDLRTYLNSAPVAAIRPVDRCRIDMRGGGVISVQAPRDIPAGLSGPFRIVAELDANLKNRQIGVFLEFTGAQPSPDHGCFVPLPGGHKRREGSLVLTAGNNDARVSGKLWVTCDGKVLGSSELR